MEITTFLTNYWEDVANKKGNTLPNYFNSEANIYLHDTNELLTVDDWSDYIGSYKGDWHTTIDRVERLENDQVMTITFHRSKSWIGFITSFFTFKDDKITELHEYYAPCDDNIVPQWRDDLAEHEIIK